MKTSITRLAAIGAVAAMAVWSGSAYAADPPAATPPTSSEPATAQPDPAQLEAGRQIVQLTVKEETFTRMFEGIMGQTTEAYARNMPEADAGRLRRILAAETRVSKEMLPDLLDSMALAYAQLFTRQELTDLIAFYELPSGRAFIAKTPELTRAVTGASVKWIPRMQEAMAAAICAEVKCTAEMRKALAPPSGVATSKP